ncbi:conserved hypothetical protein [Paraburkholderia caribensis]|nr:conserved hypothetical protein [Paraburkholderia caribensis]
MIRAFAGGWDAMAAALGYTRDALENRIYEKKVRMHVDTALAMQKLSGTKFFAEAVARESGGTFVVLPVVDDLDNDELLTKFTQILQQLGELAKRHHEALEDGVVTDVERRDLKRIADTAHRRIEELLAITFRIYCDDESEQTATRRE